jgi:predicted ATPase with chaperone activity
VSIAEAITREAVHRANCSRSAEHLRAALCWGSAVPYAPSGAHHTISDAGPIGGGSSPRPGEVSLAHHGVLLMDELPEFRRNVPEVLHQPLEVAEVTQHRSSEAQNS